MRRSAFLLASFLFAAILLGALHPVQAGTEATPEIAADPSGDWVLTVNGAAAPGAVATALDGKALDRVDLKEAWVEENATNLYFHIEVYGASTLAQLDPSAQYTYDAHFTVNATDYVPTAKVSAVMAAPTAVAPATAASVTGAVINITMPKSAIPGVHAGLALTGLYTESSLDILGLAMVPVDGTDIAPNTGAAAAIMYTIQQGLPVKAAFPNGNPACATNGTPYRVNDTAANNTADVDGDCLPNWYETKYWGNQTGGNATADDDHDGASNYAEYIAGTNPKDATSKPGAPPNTFPNGNPACAYMAGETNKTDTDGDCLPDYWELKYFGNKTSAKPGDDPDHDGYTNYVEYLAGTDPTDAQSFPSTTCQYKAGETNKTDADKDCLPDYWEKQYFGNTTAQSGTDDPDHDGCNNICEYLHGTDPKKPDTDGDGANDGDEVKAGTNPTDPGSKPTSTATATDTGSKGPVEKLQGNIDYIAESTGAAALVIVTCAIALARRWAL